MLRDERLVLSLDDAKLVPNAFGILEREALAGARDAPGLGLQPLLPEVERRRQLTRQTIVCTIPAPALPRVAPGYSKKVMSDPALPFSSA